MGTTRNVLDGQVIANARVTLAKKQLRSRFNPLAFPVWRQTDENHFSLPMP